MKERIVSYVNQLVCDIGKEVEDQSSYTRNDRYEPLVESEVDTDVDNEPG